MATVCLDNVLAGIFFFCVLLESIVNLSNYIYIVQGNERVLHFLVFFLLSTVHSTNNMKGGFVMNELCQSIHHIKDLF